MKVQAQIKSFTRSSHKRCERTDEDKIYDEELGELLHHVIQIEPLSIDEALQD